jgi:hypothetical protein
VIGPQTSSIMYFAPNGRLGFDIHNWLN